MVPQTSWLNGSDESEKAKSIVEFLEKRSQYPDQKLINCVLRDVLNPQNGEQLLEAGSGSGVLCRLMAQNLLPGGHITGIDISPTAIRIAKENGQKKGVKCSFIVTDVLGNLNEVQETFDFAYDWELLHHIFPEQRKKYVENVYRVLNPRGKYLSVCFSEKDPAFGGSGKYRETPIGTILYFSSEDELRDLFKPCFNINELRTTEIGGKPAPHLAIYAFMERQ